VKINVNVALLTSAPKITFTVIVTNMQNSGESINIIPPAGTRAHRTLVLCFDGTGNEFDAANSNVIKFYSMLKKDSWNDQRVYYQTGIGTYNTSSIAIPMLSRVSKTLDMMVASSLSQHIMAGYEWLMQTCQCAELS
jgi:uncharacterized protein (DUF2235 family)